MADIQQLNALNHRVMFMVWRYLVPKRHHAINIHHADCIYSAPGIILRGMCIIITTFDALRPEQNLPTFCRWHFKDIFVKENIGIFSIQIAPIISIIQGNGLAPYRRQSTSRTNAVLVHLSHIKYKGPNETTNVRDHIMHIWHKTSRHCMITVQHHAC